MTAKEAIDRLRIIRDDERYTIFASALEMASEALEKQTTKKPIKSDRQIRYCEVWKCPCCGLEWSGRVVDYCYRCGQAIDWTEEEEH